MKDMITMHIIDSFADLKNCLRDVLLSLGLIFDILSKCP